MCGWLTILFLTSMVSGASEVTVFSVNKTLSMGPKDTVYRDFYMNGGTNEGFRRGMSVTVIRRVPVHDLSRNKALGDLRVPVAKLKLVYVNKNISVGRVERLLEPTHVPAAEYSTVMVGDMVVLGNGLDDLGRMDDMEAPEEETKSPEGSGTNKEPDTSEVSSESSLPSPDGSPEKAKIQSQENRTDDQVNPSKGGDQNKDKESLSQKSKTKVEKKPLKTQAKPDSNKDHEVIGPKA